MTQTVPSRTVFEVIGLELEAAVAVPERARGLVLFVHSAGGTRHDVIDIQIARMLNQKRIATVLVNLLTDHERELVDERFDPATLGARVIALADHLAAHRPTVRGGLCATGTGAAGALIAAVARPEWMNAARTSPVSSSAWSAARPCWWSARPTTRCARSMSGPNRSFHAPRGSPGSRARRCCARTRRPSGWLPIS